MRSVTEPARTFALFSDERGVIYQSHPPPVLAATTEGGHNRSDAIVWRPELIK